MKPNSENVLFEGVVMSAYMSKTTNPPSEVIDVNYKTEPISVYDVTYNEVKQLCEKKLAYVNDTGWIQIVLPNYNGLKTGDKIKVIKV